MCHPVLAEAQGMPSYSSAQYREFQKRWSEVFDRSGRKEVAHAVAQYASRLGYAGTQEDQRHLATVVEDLLFGFGLSLLATTCSTCPTSQTDAGEQATTARTRRSDSRRVS